METVYRRWTLARERSTIWCLAVLLYMSKQHVFRVVRTVLAE
jgi:hypothetical protein